MTVTEDRLDDRDDELSVVERVKRFPRLRYMGSKARLIPHLARVFEEIGGQSAADPFSGSGVVSYLLKSQGFSVTSSDYLNFPAVIARASTENSTVTLDEAVVDQICGPAADDRDFISKTFDGLYFTEEDRLFLDAAWSHIDNLVGYQRDLAISALVLSAARRQPRGVFTFTDSSKYADGRRDLRLSLREHFRERVLDYNSVVFRNGQVSKSMQADVFDSPRGPFDVVYLDPPYTPPNDDNDYIKRYHFLEGLSGYWVNSTIMEKTKTKKLAKRFTPFAYRKTVEDALLRTFERYRDSRAIVLSYSSNSIPGPERMIELLGTVKSRVEVRAIDHQYSFGTHLTATRRSVQEFVFIGCDR